MIYKCFLFLFFYLILPIPSLQIPTPIKMTSKAYLKLNVVQFTVLCGLNTNLCILVNHTYKLDVKICAVSYPSSPQITQNHKNKVERLINETISKNCSSLNVAKILYEMDTEKNFKCGKTISFRGATNSWGTFNFNIGTEFTVEEWSSEIFVAGFFAAVDNICDNPILLWIADKIQLESYINTSTQPPLHLILENKWSENLSVSKIPIMKESKMYYDTNTNIPPSVVKDNMFVTKFLLNVEARCPLNYYLNGCWYYCDNVTKKKSCDYIMKEVCISGWKSTNISYIDDRGKMYNDTRQASIPECNIIDACSKNHSCESGCIITGNNTYVCDEHLLHFEPPFLAVIPGEKIRCYMKTNIKSANFINLSMSWQFVTVTVGTNNALTNMIFKEDILEINSRATYTSNNMVGCVAKNALGVIKINSTRNYTIIKFPTKISVNISKQHVYLGDYVACSSDALPLHLLKFTFDIPTNNFVVDDNSQIIRIPVKATLGEMILNCSVMFLENFRNDSTFYRNFRVYVYAMRQFKWIHVPKISIDEDECFRVVVDINVHYEIQILLLSGPSAVESISNNEVRFGEGSKGGIYVLLANLYIFIINKFISFHQIQREIIFSPPTYVKLSHIIGYPNEKIYCIIDGNSKDPINVTFSLRDSSNVVIFNCTKMVLKIPANVSLGQVFIISCEYMLIMDNITYSDSVEDNILITVRPKPYILQCCYDYVGIHIIFALLLYLFLMFLLTMLFLSRSRIIAYGTKFNYIFSTFILYNRYRKNIRYDEKMKLIAAIILEMQKNTRPGHKLKLKTFYNNLKKIYRESLTPGFTPIFYMDKNKTQETYGPILKQSLFREDIVTNEGVDIKEDLVSRESLGPLNNFYGIGPSTMKMNVTPTK